MSIWFVSRHPGAVAWAAAQGMCVDHLVGHLEPTQVQPGDTVIGTLPVNLAAELCELGANFFSLSLNLPENLRGRELSCDELTSCDARIEKFTVQKALP